MSTLRVAVERALALGGGFWGLLADGVDWERVNAAADRGANGSFGPGGDP